MFGLYDVCVHACACECVCMYTSTYVSINAFHYRVKFMCTCACGRDTNWNLMQNATKRQQFNNSQKYPATST